MDQLLIEAARDAGATLLESFQPKKPIWSEGKLVGVLGDCRGKQFEVRANLIVGADGRASWLNSVVRPAEYDIHPARTAFYYAFWRNVRHPEPLAYAYWQLSNQRCVVLICPADNDLTVVCLVLRKADVEGLPINQSKTYMMRVTAHPVLADWLKGSSTITRIWAFASTRMWRRIPFGPGWVLTGDAGMHVDPIGGRGIEHALIQSELLSKAIVKSFDSEATFDETFSAFWRTRDKVTNYDYYQIAKVAALEPLSGEEVTGLKRLRDDPAFLETWLDARSQYEDFAHKSVIADNKENAQHLYKGAI